MRRVVTPLFVLILAIFASCSLDSPEFEDQISETDVQGKWTLFTNDYYTTFEFTEGTKYYFVRHSGGDYTFGRYKKTGLYQIELTDFGVMDIDEDNYGSTYLYFDFTLDETVYPSPQHSKIYLQTTNKSSEIDMADNLQTVYMCGLWSVTSITGGGCTDCLCDGCYCSDTGECEEASCSCSCKSVEPKPQYMLFTKSGTFLTIMDDGAVEATTWQWTDTLMEEIEYWDSGDYSDLTITVKNSAASYMDLTYTDGDGTEYLIQLDLYEGDLSSTDYN